MRISLLCLFLAAAWFVLPMMAQENPTPEQPVAEQPAPEQPAAEQPAAEQPKETPKAAEDAPKDACAQRREAAYKFWLGMSLYEILIAIALLSQVLERLLEIIYVAFNLQNFKKKTLISAFLGTVIAGVACYFLQVHTLLDRVPSLKGINEWGQIAIMAFVIYCCTQPLHRVLARKSSADLIKPELPKI